MNRSINHSQALVLGIVAIAATALAVFGLFRIGESEGWTESTVPLETALRRVDGLRVGTQVRVLGIPIGQVTEIEPPVQPGEPVIVRFWIAASKSQLVRTDAAARIVKDGLVGERALEIEPGSASADPVTSGARIAASELPEWSDLVAKVHGLVEQLESGKGTVGKLVNDDEAYQSLRKLLQEGHTMLASVDENYASAKQNWLVQRFVKDRYQLLVRPDATTHRKVYAEDLLFSAGAAVLTDEGRLRLADVAKWLHAFDEQDCEVLVAGFAADETDGRLAEINTRKQAEAVLQYLTEQHTVHKTGWFRRRRVIAHGFGNSPDPVSNGDAPARRIEVLAFVK